ncbi:MAG: leucine-rich repeat domain-containing protein, partial [Ruminococcus sp.]|nr:leucine-rich repeat domain-containing protein [Ruminococcus sp.]
GVLFDKDLVALICYPAGKTNTSYMILDSVKSIGDQAFLKCSSLTSITIPSSVTYIENNAFLCCNALTDVYYTSTVSQWEQIMIRSGNDYLTSATIHCADDAVSTATSTTKTRYTISVGTVEVTLDELAAANYQVDVPITAGTSLNNLAFGIILDDGLTFVEGSNTAGGLCAAVANRKFTWFPATAMKAIDGDDAGYIKVTIDPSATAGSTYSLIATIRDADGNEAAVLDDATPSVLSGAIIITDSSTEVSGTNSISVGTVELTLDELEAADYQAQVPITVGTSFTQLAFGITLDDNLTFAAGSNDAGGLCAAAVNGQFIWFSVITKTAEIDGADVGYITVTVDPSATEGSVYNLTATTKNADGNVAAVLDDATPSVSSGAIIITETTTEETMPINMVLDTVYMYPAGSVDANGEEIAAFGEQGQEFTAYVTADDDVDASSWGISCAFVLPEVTAKLVNLTALDEGYSAYWTFGDSSVVNLSEM